MKKLSLMLVLVALLTGCGTRVQPNYAGVLMENYGKDGKSDFSLQKGRVNTKCRYGNNGQCLSSQ
jgi:hypothetical protein